MGYNNGLLTAYLWTFSAKMVNPINVDKFNKTLSAEQILSGDKGDALCTLVDITNINDIGGNENGYEQQTDKQ